jgi:4-diphosphocytidyl-2-C-methyl-D-erythritol kinase
MIVLAPAKINLTLEVLARRDDGYHGIRSVIVPLEWADELRIEPAGAFAFTCSQPDLSGADNLAARAARAVDAEPPVAISLEKRIPAQAGLGGGSSDAAAVLLAAMRGAFGRRYDLDWLATARSLGSDVPFFLAQTGALVEGTGERVTPVGRLPLWHVLIVKPPDAVSTADAYAQLDARERPIRPRSDSVSLECLTALQRHDFHAVAGCLQNDFHDVIAASTPGVARALEALREAGAPAPLLCGSGSAVFALAERESDVESWQGRLGLDASFQVAATRFATGSPWRA